MKHFHTPLIAGCLIGTLTLLSGCTTLKLPTGPQTTFKKQSWQQRRLALEKVQRWKIDGAFSIRQPNNSSIANYEWQQSGKTYNIRINSSLGIYSVVIAGKPGRITLRRSDNKSFSARSPEQLMQQQLGWRLPLSNLFYWLRGLPAPGKYQPRFGRYGHLVNLQQQGWHVQFSQYVTVNGVDMPRILQLQSGNLTVRIAIKHWKI